MTAANHLILFQTPFEYDDDFGKLIRNIITSRVLYPEDLVSHNARNLLEAVSDFMEFAMTILSSCKKTQSNDWRKLTKLRTTHFFMMWTGLL